MPAAKRTKKTIIAIYSFARIVPPIKPFEKRKRTKKHRTESRGAVREILLFIKTLLSYYINNSLYINNNIF